MIDARGLACPQPVVLAQRAVAADSPKVLEILVDDRCAVENLTRFGSHKGYDTQVSQQDGDFSLTLTKRP